MKRGRGRPRKPAKERKDVVLCQRVSKGEYRTALEQAKKEHPKLSPDKQKAIARVKVLLEESKRLGNWKLESE